MRLQLAVGICIVALPLAAAGQDAFDACAILTADEAQKALGTAVAGEPENPKARRPKVVLHCAYRGVKDNRPVEARAQFRIARNEAEQQRAFDDARLKLQTKPMLFSGAEAFWAGKVGQMHVRKGRTWFTLTVGPDTVKEREIEPARRLAEALVKKL